MYSFFKLSKQALWINFKPFFYIQSQDLNDHQPQPSSSSSSHHVTSSSTSNTKKISVTASPNITSSDEENNNDTSLGMCRFFFFSFSSKNINPFFTRKMGFFQNVIHEISTDVSLKIQCTLLKTLHQSLVFTVFSPTLVQFKDGTSFRQSTY